jgi:hypothetical protein
MLPKEPQPCKNRAAPHIGSSSNSILKIKSINIWLGYTYNSKEISLEPPIQRDLITTPEHAKSQEPANSDKTRDW